MINLVKAFVVSVFILSTQSIGSVHEVPTDVKELLAGYVTALNNGNLNEIEKVTTAQFRKRMSDGDKDHWAALLKQTKANFGKNFAVVVNVWKKCGDYFLISFNIVDEKLKKDLETMDADDLFVIKKSNEGAFIENFLSDVDINESDYCAE